MPPQTRRTRATLFTPCAPHLSPGCPSHGSASRKKPLRTTHAALAVHNRGGIPVETGRRAVPLNIHPFFIHRPHLYTVDGVAVFKDRGVIPPSLRAECLQALHSAHQGTNMMQSRADMSVFWPGITADIAHHRASCTMCNTMSPSQASLPLMPPTLPTRPFQGLSADYFHHKGDTYVVIVDRFSG